MYYNRPYGHKAMCPYCGGMHPAGQCPLMMMPPAMPMPSMPMPPMGMEEMMRMMMEHGQLLHQIHMCCQQVLGIVQAMQTGMAKG